MPDSIPEQQPELLLASYQETTEDDFARAEALVAHLYGAFTGRAYAAALALTDEIAVTARALAFRRQGR